MVRGPRTAMKSGPCLPQLQEALAQKQRPNIVINQSINKSLKKKKKKETLAPACQHLLCRCLGSRCMEPHICTFKFNNSNFFSFLIPAVISYMIPEYPIFAFSVLQYLVNQYAKTLRSNNGYSVCLLNIP